MMGAESVTEEILRNSRSGGKTYTFDDAHDPHEPAQMWFQESGEGTILFIVFYSQACRWSLCLGCSLPSKMSSQHVPYKDLIAQVDHVFADPEVHAQRKSIKKVIVSNNGSVFDEVTYSSTALMYLLTQLNLQLPNLAVLTIETRPEFVDSAELEFIARVLAEGETPTVLEVAIGFEVFDDHLRNKVFQKGMSLQTFEALVRRLSRHGFHLKCYFMQKPVPNMTDEEAVTDIQRAIDYLSAICTKYDVVINMHLNPTFVSAGTPLEDAFNRGEYKPPKLVDVARAARHAQNKNITLFIGLSDEGLAVPGGSFARPEDESLIGSLETFNRTQDHQILEDIVSTYPSQHSQ